MEKQLRRVHRLLRNRKEQEFVRLQCELVFWKASLSIENTLNGIRPRSSTDAESALSVSLLRCERNWGLAFS